MFFFPFSSHLLYQLLLLSNNLEIRPLERPHPGGHLLPLGVQEKSNRIVLARILHGYVVHVRVVWAARSLALLR